MWFWTVETDYENENERDIEFEVSESWFNNNRKGSETRSNIENERYETPQDFLDDWILDDSYEMYINAMEDNAVLAKKSLSEWTSF